MMNRSKYTRFYPFLPVALFALAAAPACKDPAESVPAAQIQGQSQPEKRATTTGERPEALQTFALSADNTRLGFVGSKVTGSHEGGFKVLSGELRLGKQLEDSTATITIDMSSVYTDQEKLTGHLKSPDFFDVAKFPTATFAITAVEEQSSKDGTHRLSGELTLHGVTRPLSFPATVESSAGSLVATAEFSINRKEFGIMYPGMKDDLIRDRVVIKLRVAVDRAQS